MRDWRTRALLVAAMGALILALTVQPIAQAGANPSKEIVGAWYVDTVGAPFLPHGMIFHADGTVILTNPDAAEAQNSSSAGYGQWEVRGKKIHGRFFEVNADKTTNQFTTLLVVTFTLRVDGKKFSGPATAEYFDGERNLVQGPFPADLLGQRFGVSGPIPDPCDTPCAT